MAKHSDEFDLDDEDFELDDWGFGDDLEGGDFLSDTPAKNDRNPVLRLGGKFVSGLGKTFVDPNVQRRMIKDNLPDGFTSAFDAGVTGVNAFNDIKRDVDKNLGSIISEAKSTLTRVSPAIEKQLPAALAKRLNEFTANKGTKAYDSGNYDPDAHERSSGMAEFLEQIEAFKMKEEKTKRNVLNKKEAGTLRNDVTQQRLLDAGNQAQSQTNSILSKILGYHTQVNTNFQMRSLELQYNQFFMARKAVDIGEQGLNLAKDSYDKIIKNTGLPDALKLRTLEHAGFLAKESVINKLNGKFSDTVGSFVNKGVKQLGENITTKAEELKSAMGDLESMVGMLDMLNGMEDEPPGAREQVIRQLESIFSMIGGIAGTKVESIARKYAEKKSLKTNSKLVRYSDKLKAMMSNGGQKINSYLNGDTDTGVGLLDNGLRSMIGGAAWNQDSKLTNNNFDDLNESTAIDFKTKRTINEIIPGYLKLMHHELKMIRTGDDSVEATSFDWQRNKFDSDKNIGKRLTEKYTGADSNIAKNADSINRFVEAIDPGKELSRETRKSLSGLVAKNMANGGSIFDVYTMLNDFNPQGPNGEKQRAELSAFVEARGIDVGANTSNEIERARTIKNQSGLADKFYNSFNNATDQSRWDYEDSNEDYQKLIELGFGEQLAAAGLVVQDDDGGWSVNQENIDKKTQRRAYKGFAVGGDTGPGNKYDVKGNVHANEFVVRSEVTKQPGVKSFLNQLNMIGSSALNKTAGYALGGDVQDTSTVVDGGNKAGVTLESIIEAIRSINPITHLKEMGQSLRGIEFSSMRELMGNVEQLPQQMRNFYENNIQNAKPTQSLKQQWDRFTDKAKQNKIWDTITGGKKTEVESTQRTETSEAAKTVSNLKEVLGDQSDGKYQADIYTEDDTVIPKLTIDGFKNGEYFDEATGAPVESVKDIKGTVVDKLGNIKLHAKDFGKKLISPSTYVSGFLKTTKFGMSTSGKLLGKATSFLAKHDAWGKLKKGAKWLKSGISHLNTDVFIKGEEEPVLLLKELKAGNYYNGERKQITDYKHITGNIYDTEGNLVLAEDKYTGKDLVGLNGKRLTGFGRKNIRRITNIAKLGMSGLKGFNKFRKKAWQGQFKLLYGAKDIITGTRKKTPEQLEEERYNEYMMQNANPDGKDKYANGWERFKGKIGDAQKGTRDYLTGERDKRKATEANIGQLLDHDGNPVPAKKDAYDALMGWAKSGKDKLVDKAKDKLGQATGNVKDMSEQAQYQAWLAAKTINNPDRESGKTLTDKGKGLLDTAQGKLKTGLDSAKGAATDIAEKARLEAWYLKNTINNPDRETGETLSDKAHGKLDSVMKKVKESIPDWLSVSKEDDEELKRYKATLRKYWMEEQKTKLTGFINKGKAQTKKIDWKAAEAKVRSLMPTGDDIRYEAKKFEMHLSDKGITKAGVTNSLRAASDKLTAKVKESIPVWMSETTEDDEEVKRYKAKLREYWVEEQKTKIAGKAKALKGKAKVNWTNAQKQLESMLPTDEQKAKFRETVTTFTKDTKAKGTKALNDAKVKGDKVLKDAKVHGSKVLKDVKEQGGKALKDASKTAGGILTNGKAKFSAITGKWGLDKDEKGPENKNYRDKGTTRLVRDIHRLLEERLPKPKKGIWNDSDGNGFREGSVEDQLADRANKKTDPITGIAIPKDEKKKPKGLLGILMGIAGAISTGITMIGGFFAKAMGFGKLIKNWMAKQAALKALGGIAGGGGGGCCCGGDGDDYNDRNNDRNKKRKNRRRPGRTRTPTRLPRGAGGAAGRAGGRLSTRIGAGLMRGPGLAKLAGAAVLAGGAGLAISQGANAGEVGGDLAKESLRATPGVGTAVDVYDTVNDNEGSEPGLFNNMWNGTKDALGLNTKDDVATFARDTAVTTAGMAAVGGAISGGLAGTGLAAGALAALGGPVTLGIILGGAAIYGGIKLYQALEKGDKPLIAFRMAQYGYKESSKSEMKLILKLEDELSKLTRVQGTTVAFTKADEAVSIAIKTLGINTSSAIQMKYFTEWFNGRFKPVYFSWVAASNTIKKGGGLAKLDDTLKPQEKLDLMSTVHSEVKSLGAYNVGTSYNAEKALLSGDAVDKAFKSHQNSIEKPQDRVSKEKAVAEKQEQESTKSTYWERTKNMFSSAASDTGSKLKEVGKSAVAGANAVAGSIMNGVRSAWDGAKEVASNVVATMTGSQKEWQMKVYQAFKKAGFSEQQSRILTAEIGRENSYNPKIMFGGHADPHSGKNLGMLSWQGARTPKLVAFLSQAGVLDKAGNMIPSQAALDAQAKFIMWEMNNTHKKASAEFLGNPNIEYAKGAYIVGKKYILWRIDDPKYGPGGKKNRDGFYNMLVKQLGGTAAKTEEVPAAKAAPRNAAGIPITLAKPGTNNTGLSLDPSKKPNVAGMAMPGAPKSAPSGAGILADPKKAATVGNSMGKPEDKYANNKAIKAAKIATQKALGSSSGYCAKYVANALQGAGFKFTRQNSAFQYHTNGIMKGMGFVAINANTAYQCGDVAVWPAHGGKGGGGIHGHIQIYNGKNWVSDFIQKNFIPGPAYRSSTPTLYRDKELVGANVQTVVDSNKAAGEMGSDNNGVDTQSPGGAVAANMSKYSGKTIGDVIKLRKEAGVKIYGADGAVSDYVPGAAAGTKAIPSTATKTSTTSPTNTANQTSSKPTIMPGIAGFVATKPATTKDMLSSTSGGTTVDNEKAKAAHEIEATKAAKGNPIDSQNPTAMRNAQMASSTSSVGNTSSNFPAESIRLFNSMDSKLSQVVTALNKIAVISQDGVKAQVQASNKQTEALGATAKAITTVSTAVMAKPNEKSEDKKTNVLKAGVIGAGKPQPVSVLS